MNYYILDTNILVKDPSVLSQHGEGITFLLPDIVLQELQSITIGLPSLKQTLSVARESLKQGVQLLPSPKGNRISQLLSEHKSSREGSFADKVLFESAIEFGETLPIEERDKVFLVTEDVQVYTAGKTTGIQVIGLDELRSRIVLTAQTNKAISTIAKRAKRIQITSLLIGILGSMVGLASSLSLDRLSGVIVRSVNIWGTIVVLPILGVILFAIRSRFRFFYGLTEALFGVGIALRTFLPQFDYSKLDGVGVIQVIGGLYIIVRGLDNVGTGLIGTRWELGWKKFFR